MLDPEPAAATTATPTDVQRRALHASVAEKRLREDDSRGCGDMERVKKMRRVAAVAQTSSAAANPANARAERYRQAWTKRLASKNTSSTPLSLGAFARGVASTLSRRTASDTPATTAVDVPKPQRVHDMETPPHPSVQTFSAAASSSSRELPRITPVDLQCEHHVRAARLDRIDAAADLQYTTFRVALRCDAAGP